MMGMLIVALAGAPLQTEQMRVRPSTEEAAVAEFESSCMGALYNKAAVARAATASPRGYVKSAPTADGRVTSWESSWGSLHYVEAAAGTRAPTLPQCNFTAFTRAKVDRKALDAALAAMVERQVSGHYTEAQRGTHLAWSWTDGEGRPATLLAVLDRKTPQQITLSLQSVEGPR